MLLFLTFDLETVRRWKGVHWKDKMPKFQNKYSQKRNIGASVPISTFMRLWAIYIFPRSVFLFCWRKYVDPSWDYINRSETHECWNWGWGRAISRKGIHKWDFRCIVALPSHPLMDHDDINFSVAWSGFTTSGMAGRGGRGDFLKVIFSEQVEESIPMTIKTPRTVKTVTLYLGTALYSTVQE